MHKQVHQAGELLLDIRADATAPDGSTRLVITHHGPSGTTWEPNITQLADVVQALLAPSHGRPEHG